MAHGAQALLSIDSLAPRARGASGRCASGTGTGVSCPHRAYVPVGERSRGRRMWRVSAKCYGESSTCCGGRLGVPPGKLHAQATSDLVLEPPWVALSHSPWASLSLRPAATAEGMVPGSSGPHTRGHRERWAVLATHGLGGGPCLASCCRGAWRGNWASGTRALAVGGGKEAQSAGKQPLRPSLGWSCEAFLSVLPPSFSGRPF